MTDARQALYEKLERAFENGVLEPHEQADLRKLYSLGQLTIDDVRGVFAKFVADEWGRAMADGVVTPEEKQKLTNIVTQLKLPEALVPDEVRRAIG